MSEETASAIPYVNLLEGRDPLEVLQATPDRLAGLLAQLSPEQVEHKPAPAKWSTREIMAHLADCEIAWGWRFRQVFGEDNPTLQPFDQDAWAGSYASYSPARAQATWEALRGWNIAFLGGLTEVEKGRAAHHPKIGSLTLWTLAGIAAGHDLHHLHSLERVVRAFSRSL
jgi:uncharacterized damage-inducible protein DinB